MVALPPDRTPRILHVNASHAHKHGQLHSGVTQTTRQPWFWRSATAIRRQSQRKEKAGATHCVEHRPRERGLVVCRPEKHPVRPHPYDRKFGRFCLDRLRRARVTRMGVSAYPVHQKRVAAECGHPEKNAGAQPEGGRRRERGGDFQARCSGFATHAAGNLGLYPVWLSGHFRRWAQLSADLFTGPQFVTGRTRRFPRTQPGRRG